MEPAEGLEPSPFGLRKRWITSFQRLRRFTQCSNLAILLSFCLICPLWFFDDTPRQGRMYNHLYIQRTPCQDHASSRFGISARHTLKHIVPNESWYSGNLAVL